MCEYAWRCKLYNQLQVHLIIVGPIRWGWSRSGICSRDWMTSLCHPPLLLLVSPLRSWFSPGCCGGVRLVVKRCFWDVDGCEWRFGGELTDSNNTRPSVRHTWLQVPRMCSEIFPRGSVYSTGYRPCLAYHWAHGAGLSHTLQIQAKGWGWRGIMSMQTDSWKSFKAFQTSTK